MHDIEVEVKPQTGFQYWAVDSMTTSSASCSSSHVARCPWRIGTVSTFNAMSHCYTEVKQQFASHRVLANKRLTLLCCRGLKVRCRKGGELRTPCPSIEIISIPCQVTRDIPTLITNSGFQIDQIEMAYLAPFPQSWPYCFWGTATPRNAIEMVAGSSTRLQYAKDDCQNRCKHRRHLEP